MIYHNGLLKGAQSGMSIVSLLVAIVIASISFVAYFKVMGHFQFNTNVNQIEYQLDLKLKSELEWILFQDRYSDQRFWDNEAIHSSWEWSQDSNFVQWQEDESIFRIYPTQDSLWYQFQIIHKKNFSRKMLFSLKNSLEGSF